MRYVQEYDTDICRGWKEDLDTLLVFAGLFSATVTAFTIESYKWLQEDPNVVSSQTLSRIELRLAGFNTTIPEPSAFRADTSSVTINVLWLMSLTISLGVAVLSILCKQWVHEYQSYPAFSGNIALAMRQLRLASWETWRVPDILGALPILLEVALALFSIGLINLMWTLHRGIAILLSALVASTFAAVILTTVLPACCDIALRLRKDISSACLCPFKSLQSMIVLRFTNLVIELFRSLLFHITGSIVFSSAVLKHGKSYSFRSPFLNWAIYDFHIAIELGAYYGDRRFSDFLHKGLNWISDYMGGDLEPARTLFHCLLSLDDMNVPQAGRRAGSAARRFFGVAQDSPLETALSLRYAPFATIRNADVDMWQFYATLQLKSINLAVKDIQDHNPMAPDAISFILQSSGFFLQNMRPPKDALHPDMIWQIIMIFRHVVRKGICVPRGFIAGMKLYYDLVNSQQSFQINWMLRDFLEGINAAEALDSSLAFVCDVVLEMNEMYTDPTLIHEKEILRANREELEDLAVKVNRTLHASPEPSLVPDHIIDQWQEICDALEINVNVGR